MRNKNFETLKANTKYKNKKLEFNLNFIFKPKIKLEVPKIELNLSLKEHMSLKTY